MKKITIIALFAAFGMVSCKDTKADATPTTTEATTDATSADSHAGHDHSAHDGHDHSGHDHGTTTEVAEGMNPPHGQPGHRCDIAVGAPLNSPAGQAAPQNTAAPANQGGFLGSGETAAPAAQQQAPAAQQTAPGMQGKPNPAHGLPGHRCDIQVGQPLP